MHTADDTHHLVILKRGKATVRDRTTAGNTDAAERTTLAACTLSDPIRRANAAVRRKVARNGFAAAHDDIGKT